MLTGISTSNNTSVSSLFPGVVPGINTVVVVVLGASKMQSSARVEPIDEFGVWTLHGIHGALPVVSLNEPAAHAEQLPAVPVYPLAQSARQVPVTFVNAVAHVQAVLFLSGTLFSKHNMQAPSLVDPIGEIELPVPQTLHGALPVVALYFPAAHSKQLPAVPVFPRSQSFSQVAATSVNKGSQSQPVFPRFVTLFTPHDVQELALVEPAGEIGVFRSQSTHKVLPTVLLYVPPGHTKQLPAVPVDPLAQSASQVPETSVNKSLQTQPAFPKSTTLFSPHNVQALALVDPAGEIGVLA